jgi:AcrR family transcriptional regulator
MAEEKGAKRRRKGEVAQQRIVESALRLFGDKGYEQTTMRDIAAAAGYSPGLTYRYFSSKEELVLVLYQKLAQELHLYARSLPAASLTERFQMTVAKQLELMAPYRETLGALFGTALNPRSKVGVFGESTAAIRRQARETYLAIIEGAKDAPRASQCEDLATILYGTHLALVLFWLIDQSAETQRTQKLLAFLCDLLKLIQPILWFPVVSQALARLARIIGPLLGADEPSVQQDIQEKEQKEP